MTGGPAAKGHDMRKATLTILCEDQARMGFLDKKFSGQHGLAVLVELDGGPTVLLDTGPGPVILDNARLAGKDLARTDLIVISHGHWDHGDGLPHLAAAGVRPPLLLHPEAFNDRCRADGLYNGMAMSRDQAAEAFELRESRDPVHIDDGLWFLGQVPRNNDFEARSTTFIRRVEGRREPEFLLDDTALAMVTDQGLAVITGCSHAGVCNICDHAMAVTGVDRLHMVLGGFHLLDASEVLDRTVDYMRARNVPRLCPMHCTAMPAMARFHAEFGCPKLCCGDTVDIP